MEEQDDQEALNKAILQSLQTSPNSKPVTHTQEIATTSMDDDDLRRAINLSLEGSSSVNDPSFSEASTSTGAISDSVEFIRQRRLMRLGQLSSPNNP